MANPFANESTSTLNGTPPTQIKPVIEETIKVKVPSSGGGYTSITIPKGEYEYLRDQQEENQDWRQYQENYIFPKLLKSPEAIDIARQQQPHKYAQPTENFLNNAMFGGFGLARASVTGALNGLQGSMQRWMQRWMPRLSFRSTYGTTPLATAGDAAMISIPTALSASDMIQNGPTVENVTGTALGLGGLAFEATPTIINGVQNAQKFRQALRLRKELNTLAEREYQFPIFQNTNESDHLLTYNEPIRTRRIRFPFNERPSHLTSAERAGISGHDRTNVVPFLQGSESSVPEDILLINRANHPYQFENGRLVWNYTPTPSGGRRITHHFTLDQPVMAHGSGNWDLVKHTMVVPYRHIVQQNGQPLNVDIMDTYFGGFGRFAIDQDKVRILTADPNIFRRYKLQGIQVEYSPESNRIIEQANNLYKQLEPLEQKRISSVGNLSLEERKLYDSLQEQLRELQRQNYEVVSKWTSSVGRRPNMNDINIIESESGLKTGAVASNSPAASIYGSYPRYKNISYFTAPPTHSNDFVMGLELQEPVQLYRDFNGRLVFPEAFAPQRRAVWEQMELRYPRLFDRTYPLIYRIQHKKPIKRN